MPKLVRINTTIGGTPTCQVGMDVFDIAVWEGRAFSVGTGLKTLGPQKVLSYILANPAGSGRNAYVTVRSFYTDSRASEQPLLARFIPSPDELGDMDSATPSNLNTGGAASALTFKSKVSNERLNRSPAITDPTGFVLPTGGRNFEIRTPRLLSPGESFGFYVYGGSDDADKVSMNAVWYEEDA